MVRAIKWMEVGQIFAFPVGIRVGMKDQYENTR